MTDEAPTDTGSLEAAADAIREARQAPPEPANDGNRQPEPADTAPAATSRAPQESPPDQPQAADADPQPEPDAEEPTIEGPSWLTAEERALYAALPPEQQQAVQRLASSTKAAESRRQNEHQAAVKAAQEAAEQAAHERQYFASAIQKYRHPVEAAFRQQFADVISGQVDLFRLAQTDRWPVYQAFQAEFAQLGHAEQQLAQQAEQEKQTQLQKHVEDRNSQLFDARPELKDPAKFQEFDNNVTGYLRGLEIPDEQIARISFKELTIVEKAMKWDAAQKAKANVPKQPLVPAGKQPVQGYLRTVPKPLKPGTAGNSGAADDKIAAIDQQGRKSGSVDDAAARIRLRLSGRRA
jgi:hypothetical protein